jgi:tetratricopeptide (TPR) repeat protein
MQENSAIAFRLPLIDKGREEEGASYVPRLFRNAPGLFYVGRIHEQVFSSIEVRRAEWGLQNRFGDVTLLHHGYTDELVQSRDKTARNLSLLQKAIAEMPGEPILLMNLGLELARSRRLTEGLEQYAAAFAALASLPRGQVVPELRESLLTQYCTHLLTVKNYAEISRVFQSSLAQAGGLTATMHWLFGLACIESKLYADGAEQMRQCLAKRARPALTPVNKNILRAGPSHCLALCLAALKQPEASGRAFRAALKEDPNGRPVRFDYARFLAESGHEVEALKSLHQLVTEDSAEIRAWQLGGHIALSKPEFLEFGCDWTGEAVKLHPNDPMIQEQRATALLLSGRAEEALTLWERLSTPFNPTHRAAVTICQSLLQRPLQDIPAHLASHVNQEFISWYRRLLAVNASQVIQRLNQHTKALRQIVPDAVRILESAFAEANAVIPG